MINWNTVPMTYNDSLTYMEMMGKVLTVVQQMYDTLEHIVIDSEQININKEDIADLKESVSALSDSVDNLTERMQALETLTAGRTTPEYQALTSADITVVNDDYFRIAIPESMLDADGYLVSFSFKCVFSDVTYYQKVTLLVHDEVAYYYTYVHTAGGDEPIKLILNGINPADGYIEFAAVSDAGSYDIGSSDEGGIVAFWEKTE